MDATPPQRVDIVQVVGEFRGKSPRKALEDAEASVEAPRRPVRGAPAGPWYVVVDDILEGKITLEAWPWPAVNHNTGYLDFDLSMTRRFTRDAEDVHRVVSVHRRAHEEEPAASRALRIGDVFEVSTTDVKDLAAWTDVHDHTRDKRAEARAALDAMAAQPVPADKAEELERLAREQEPQPEPVVQLARAHPAV
ncbi:MAG TPA: hypothetical protein VFR23_04570 [Jiangellaceae bacterium]|nr:hypothetical protein [Jiangellaceae bacterium]